MEIVYNGSIIKQTLNKKEINIMTYSITNVTSNYVPAKNLSPFFEVTRAPMSAMVDGEYKTVARDALLSPNGDLMGVVSPRYKVVTNNSVVNVFDEFFSTLKIQKVVDRVSGNGAKWIRDYIIEDENYVVTIGKKNDDVLKTKVSVSNGYDGKTSVSLDFSAYRQICSNGMMGWKKTIGTKFSHFSIDILSSLKSTLDVGFVGMKKNFNLFDTWTKIPYTEKQFMGFIDDRSYLSDKQKEATKGLYLPVMNQYKEEETVWGAYNVITAIATHHTASRNKSVDNIFSSGYKTMAKVAKDFFEIPKAA